MVPSKITWVPELRPVRSRVLPEGTARALRTMVEQEVLDLLADEAPPEPEKVHVVARSSRFGAAVGAGAAAGAATTTDTVTATRLRIVES